MRTVLAVFWAFLITWSFAGEEAETKALGRSKEASYEDKVVVIKVGEDSLVSEQSFKFFHRTLKRVEEEKAKAVIFELDTPGGYAFMTTDLMIKDMARLSVPTYAYVNVEATSAGAFVAVATDTIYMAPLSTIGSSAVVSGSGVKMEETMRAKVEALLKSAVRGVTEKKGHNYEVIEAMMLVDKKARFGDIARVGKGELLNLTAQEATSEYKGKPLLAKGIAESIEDLLEQEGLAGSEVVVAEMTGFEKLAFWVGSVGGLLIVIGFGAGFLEMKTPGFGVGAVIAIIAFSLFFFGNYVAGNMAGYETAAIFVVGVVFIFLDIFLFPGTFVMGFVGVLMVLGSLLFSMVDRFRWDSWKMDDVKGYFWNTFEGPAQALSIGLLGAIVLFAIMMRYLPRLPFLNRYFLPASVEGESGMIEEGGERKSRVGWTGEATTDLRPSGKASFDGENLDVTAQNSFVKEGAALRIVSEDGMGIVVKEIEKVV